MCNADVYWSVVLRHRWWSWFDRGELWLLEERRGAFDGASVRRIAGMYGVARGLHLLPGEMKTYVVDQDESIKAERAEKLAAALNDIFLAMPEDMVDRSKHLLDRHVDIASYVHNRQLSALSKFAWFANPKGWTMFDRLASGGIKARGYDSFYSKLVKLNFVATTEEIHSVLNQYGLQDMWAERILDHFLVLRGSSQIESNRDVARAYLNSLPADQRSRLDGAAEGVAVAISAHSIIESAI
jgi:hypothetical protein